MLFSEMGYVCRESLAKLIKALCCKVKSLLVLHQVVCCYHWDLKGEGYPLRNLRMKFTNFIVGMLSENYFYPYEKKIYTYIYFNFNAYARSKFAVWCTDLSRTF